MTTGAGKMSVLFVPIIWGKTGPSILCVLCGCAANGLFMKEKYHTFWIIGAGECGKRAAKKLRKKFPEASLTVVDQDQGAMDGIEGLPIVCICMGGASYLETHMDGQNEPDWIIPAVPIHLAFEWIRRKLSRDRRIEVEAVPQAIESMLPNPKRGMQGQLYVSYADFRCPDHCTEPYDLCTWTGKPRKGLLYKKIENVLYMDYISIVIRSHKLAGGVGGYEPQALRKSLAEVSKATTPVIYSTACLCHGVMHAFRLL
jgi:hypothetical protein